nr:O-antigen ligase family protein [Gemmatimonadaceae bacterium]
MVKDHPLYGVGIGAYSYKHELDAAERREWWAARGPRDTHNMYLNLAAETGLPGLALFVGMLGSVLLYAFRAERAMRLRWAHGAEALRALRFGLIAYLLAAVFGTFHRASFLFVYIGLLWSAATTIPLLAQSDARATGAQRLAAMRVSLRRFRQWRGTAAAGAPVLNRRGLARRGWS